MSKQTINVGSNQDDGTGDLLRTAFTKVNDNFTELYNEVGGTSLSNLRFSGSTITTDETNTNIIINPNGVGKVDIQADALFNENADITGAVTIGGNLGVTGGTSLASTLTVGSTLDVTGATTLSSTLGVTGTSTLASFTASGTAAITGTTTLSGNLIANGNVDLGDASGDTVTFTGRVDSSIVPSAGGTYDFGGSSQRWKTGYFDTIDVTTLSVGATVMDTISISGNKISTNATNANIELDPIGTGIVDIRSNLTLNGNTMTGNVTGNLVGNVTGNIGSSGTSTFTTVDINGGAIDGTTIGAAAQAAGSFSQVTVDRVGIDTATISTSSGDLILASAGDVSVSNKKITQLAAPASGTDATNKTYVDGRTFQQITDASATTTNHVTIDNLNFADNNISSVNTNSDIVLIPAGTGKLDIRGNTTIIDGGYIGSETTPTAIQIEADGDVQFSGSIVMGNDLYTNGKNITSGSTNQDVTILASGTGNVVIDAHVRLPMQSGNPTTDTSSGYVFSKLDTNAEVHVMDGAGNVTKVSPHNSDGDWEYYSHNVKTGKVMRVNMERMIKKLEELTGETFIEEV